MAIHVDKNLLGIKEFSGVSNELKGPFQGPNVSFAVSNTGSSAEARLLAISAGWYDQAADIKDSNGKVVDAILKDGEVIETADKKVIATGKNCKVIDVQKMFAKTPCRIKSIRVKVDDAAQLDEEIQILELTPSGPSIIARIIPSSAKNEDNSDPKMASVSLLENNIVLGEDRIFLMNLAAGRTVTLTVYYENRASFAAQIEYLTKNAAI